MAAPSSDNKNHPFPDKDSSIKGNATGETVQGVSFEDGEARFKEALKEPLSRAERIGTAGIVVGIPFYNEADTIGPVLKTVTRGLEEFFPGQKSVVVAAGSPAGGEALKIINSLPQSGDISRISFLLNDEKINGKGWSLRAITEIAHRLGADLAIIEADLVDQEHIPPGDGGGRCGP